ncbi:MAG: general secretion pathway protein GspN [endosymbiont of Escarpia spicata]|uniref:Type II secretion system protein N n=1 Tax=endosymbiont of Escarpia spicata TaxID=2200908 RepID=A0A370DSQ5_9GAMM|nr:MAG: general secretion pathway protein GspN [endosymbiont of Escarpia spicata]
MRLQPGPTILGIGCFVVFLIAATPARHVLGWLGETIAPLTLADSSGTIWSGSATETHYNGVNLGTTAWRFQPLDLLTRKLRYRLSLRGPGQQLDGYAGVNIDGSYQAEHLKGIVKARIIPGLLNQPIIGAIGDLDIDISSIQFAASNLTEAAGKIRWQGAGITSPVAVDLGGMQFDIKGDENGLRSSIQDIGGGLSIKGELNLAPTGTYRISGRILPKASADPALVNTLKTIGKSGTGGSIQLNFSGQL